VNSCIYLGTVRHRRHRPQVHEFKYPLFMLLLDLAELDQVFAGRWLWSARTPNVARFKREDHFGEPAEPLETSVRNLVQRELGRCPEGPVRLLTHLRYFGYCFNPISIFFCYRSDGGLDALVAEVTNTPWKERRLYVIDGHADRRGDIVRQRFAKDLHVSPFMPMGLTYDWRCSSPGERLSLHMNVSDANQVILDATLALRRLPLTGSNLALILMRFPWMTVKVIFAIHWQALRLWLKGVPVFDHPAAPSQQAAQPPEN
jgi:uncharacterized protein